MIETRRIQTANKARRGLTLTEIAIVLGVFGIVASAIWLSVYRVYENNKINQAEAQWGLLAAAIEKMAIQGQLDLPPAGSNGNLPVSSLTIGNSGWYYSGVINTELALGGLAPGAMIDGSTSPPALMNPWSYETQTSGNGATAVTADGVIVTVGTLTPGGLTIPSNDSNAMTLYANASCGGVLNQSCIPTANGVDGFEIAFNNIPSDACIALALAFAGESRPSGVVTIFIGMSNWAAGGGIGMGGASSLPITLAQATTLCAQATNPYDGSSTGFASSFIDIVYQL